MVQEFTYEFNELKVQTSDIEEILGFSSGEVPEPFPELIEKGISEAPEHCTIKGGIKIYETAELDQKRGTIKIDGQLFQPAKIVNLQLKDAAAIALFACTTGSGITNYSKKVEKGGDQIYSYVLDVIGSIVVEKTADKMQDSLKDKMIEKGAGISDRFSPGYCDWNVSDQQKLFRLLPKNFCGIKLSESSLMDPIKSVSGIIGIGPGLKQLGYQCYWCNDANCIYGRTKRKKMSKKNG